MRDLPPPLPPAERTVGQLIGETIRAYGAQFWRLLPIGLPLAAVDQGSVHQTALEQVGIFYIAGPFVTAAYVYACSVVLKARLTATAFWLGLAIYAPFPVLRALYVLPAIAWFALVGLAVPACLVERLPFRAAFVRGRRLGRADLVHALGSLAAIVLVVAIAEITLQRLLHSQSDASERAALALADVVLTPLLYIGGALLYHDQAARVGSSANADIHSPLDADAARRPDAEGQP